MGETESASATRDAIASHVASIIAFKLYQPNYELEPESRVN